MLGELSLEEHAATRIGSLSGGQRKRTGVATELLSRPSVLFLDEPTTGLDPGLETQMMQLLRELSRGGRARRGGHPRHQEPRAVRPRGGHGPRRGLAFDGAPEDALDFFGVDDYDGIYTALPTRSPDEWGKRYHDTAERADPDGRAGAGARGPPAARASSRRWGCWSRAT